MLHFKGAQTWSWLRTCRTPLHQASMLSQRGCQGPAHSLLQDWASCFSAITSTVGDCCVCIHCVSLDRGAPGATQEGRASTCRLQCLQRLWRRPAAHTGTGDRMGPAQHSLRGARNEDLLGGS